MIANDLDELEKLILKKVMDAMTETGKKAVEVVKDKVDEVVYMDDPTDYQRTFELRDSVMCIVTEKDSLISAEVFNANMHNIPADSANVRVIRPYADGSGSSPVSALSQHASVIDGTDYSQYVAQTVEEGSSGDILGDPLGERFWMEPRPFMADSHHQLESEKIHVTELKKNLIKYGLDVK